MYGNGMTGAPVFLPYDVLVSKSSFLGWLDSLRQSHEVIGPVREGDQTVFMPIGSSGDLFMEYGSTMLPPGKLYLYPPKEDIFRFSLGKELGVEERLPEKRDRVLVALHPCDVNAIFYLDKTFLGAFRDPAYEERRSTTLLICLNCSGAGQNCFCASLGTGPFFGAKEGCDLVITDLGENYLAEIRSERMQRIFSAELLRAAGPEDRRIRKERESAAIGSFKKKIDTSNIDRLLMENTEHPVWQRVADELCLSCTNCVMVCPTCFCYDVVDEVAMDMKSARRYRAWDACQDAYFAEVHGGNYRARRAARLRQFVTHKFDQTWQYGVMATVGCGRCITWCPTNIDFTGIVKEIQAGGKKEHESHETLRGDY